MAAIARRQTLGKRANPWLAFVIPVLVFALLGYGVVALGTGDPLWVLQKATGAPTEIIVYLEGEQHVIRAGDPGFDDLSYALQTTLSETRGYNQFLGISDQTLADYRQVYWAVEARYSDPLVLHSQYRFGNPRQALIPLSGRHADRQVVFLGNNDVFAAGPYLDDVLQLRRTLETHSLAPTAQ